MNGNDVLSVMHVLKCLRICNKRVSSKLLARCVQFSFLSVNGSESHSLLHIVKCLRLITVFLISHLKTAFSKCSLRERK